MATIPNPMYSSVLPGSLIPGTTSPGMSMPYTGGGTSGANVLLPGGPSTVNGPVSTNPYTSSAPNFPANSSSGYSSSTNLGAPGSTGTPNGPVVPGALPGTPGGPPNTTQMAQNSPFSFLNAMTPKDISRLFDSLKKTYGDGMAHMMLDFLTSGAGFNQQAVNNLLASLGPGIERGTESLMSQFSASGNRFGSGAQIGLGDFLSQVNLNEGQLVTQMYESALQNFMDVMMGGSQQVAQNKATSPSFLDSLLGIGSNVAQGIGALPGMPGWASIMLGA